MSLRKLFTGTDELPPDKKKGPAYRALYLNNEEPTTVVDDIRWYCDRIGEHAMNVVKIGVEKFDRGMNEMSAGAAEVATLPVRNKTAGIATVAALLTIGAINHNKIKAIGNRANASFVRDEALRFSGNDYNGKKVNPVLTLSKDAALNAKPTWNEKVLRYVKSLHAMTTEELQDECTILERIIHQQKDILARGSDDPTGTLRTAACIHDGAVYIRGAYIPEIIRKRKDNGGSMEFADKGGKKGKK